jgi:hypothetical protein
MQPLKAGTVTWTKAILMLSFGSGMFLFQLLV